MVNLGSLRKTYTQGQAQGERFFLKSIDSLQYRLKKRQNNKAPMHNNTSGLWQYGKSSSYIRMPFETEPKSR